MVNSGFAGCVQVLGQDHSPDTDGAGWYAKLLRASLSGAGINAFETLYDLVFGDGSALPIDGVPKTTELANRLGRHLSTLLPPMWTLEHFQVCDLSSIRVDTVEFRHGWDYLTATEDQVDAGAVTGIYQ